MSWPFKSLGVRSLPGGAILFPGAGSITAAVRNVLWGDLVPGDRCVELIYPHCSIQPKADSACWAGGHLELDKTRAGHRELGQRAGNLH